MVDRKPIPFIGCLQISLSHHPMSLVASQTLMGTSVLNILFTLIDLGLNFVFLKTKWIKRE